MSDTEQTEFKLLIRGLKREDYPEGQICIEDKGRVVAAAHAIRVSADDFESRHTYDDLIDGGKMTGHDPDGNALYGIDVFVDPDYRGLRLGSTRSAGLWRSLRYSPGRFPGATAGASSKN